MGKRLSFTVELESDKTGDVLWEVNERVLYRICLLDKGVTAETIRENR